MEGRKSRAVAGKPHRDPDLGLLAAAAADDRPVRGRAVGSGAGVVRPGLPLQPLRRPEDAALHRRRRRCRRRAGCRRPDPAGAQLPQEPGQAGRGPVRGSAARSRGSPSTSSARAPAAPCTPGCPVATPATPRPRRCSPSRPCAWRSTTTRRPPARSPRPRRWPRTCSPACRRPGCASRSSEPRGSVALLPQAKRPAPIQPFLGARRAVRRTGRSPVCWRYSIRRVLTGQLGLHRDVVLVGVAHEGDEEQPGVEPAERVAAVGEVVAAAQQLRAVVVVGCARRTCASTAISGPSRALRRRSRAR